MIVMKVEEVVEMVVVVKVVMGSTRNIRDVVKQRVQRLRRVFDCAFGGVGDDKVIIGEGVVVTSSSLEEEA
ncbi:hypothetical protein Tco_0285130 [Tanacetum coccineum]